MLAVSILGLWIKRRIFKAVVCRLQLSFWPALFFIVEDLIVLVEVIVVGLMLDILMLILNRKKEFARKFFSANRPLQINLSVRQFVYEHVRL